MSKFDLDSFGNIMDRFLEENEIKMLITLPEGTLDATVEDNAQLGSVVQFYIVLNAIASICDRMIKDMGIDSTTPEWEQTIDALLTLVKNEITGGSTESEN